MGMITDASVAAGTSVQIVNTPLALGSEVLPRKILIIATALSGYQDKHVKGTPFLVLSPDDVASKCGFGGMAHRLAIAAFRGSKNAVPVYCLILADNSAATMASGTITLTVSNPEAGTLSLYVAGKKYAVPVLPTDTADMIGNRIYQALFSDTNCPINAVNVDGELSIQAKSAGPYGNDITIAVNQRPSEGETLPTGVNASITGMNGGAGLPDLAAELPLALGNGDSANEAWYTDVIHGFGKDSAILNALSEYNGVGNENAGLYSETIARPFRSLVGDVSAGSPGFQALIEFSDTRKSDRTSGIVCRPGSLTNPAEIASEAVGVMACINMQMAEMGYNEELLSGVDPGLAVRLAGNDWTSDYTNRDRAVHSGLSPIKMVNGTTKLTNVVSFYRPDNIPEKNRCFRRMRDISIIQNIQNLIKQIFGSSKWTNFTVVSDIANVQNSDSRAKARDAGMVRDELLNIITQCMNRGWIFDPAPSIAFLGTDQAVQRREDGSGFNIRVPVVLSGEGNILDTVVEVDTSFAVMAAI